jgi:hypothetical protein
VTVGIKRGEDIHEKSVPTIELAVNRQYGKEDKNVA